MKAHRFAFVTLLLPVLIAAPAPAAEAVHADIVVHVSRVQPTDRLVETMRVTVPYGGSPGHLGFVPKGPERVAVGPSAFDVDAQGTLVVADPVHQRVVRIRPGGSKPQLTRAGRLPLPFTDLAVDRTGAIHVADLQARRVTMLASENSSVLPRAARAMRFSRHGQDLVLRTGAAPEIVHRGSLSAVGKPVTVRKCNAEAGLVTRAGHTIQVEIGGPLASMRIIGVNTSDDVFMLVERFRKRGSVEVDRQVVVVDRQGRVRATRDVVGTPALALDRDFTLGADGSLHRMIPGATGVTFVRWEVRS